MPSLGTLPLELWTEVSTYLSHDDLDSFSRVSTYCCHATNATMFRDVYLVPFVQGDYPEDLGTDITLVTTALARRACQQHVRRLIVRGRRGSRKAESRARGYYKYTAKRQSLAEVQADDQHWIPLAVLIRDLPSLLDFEYDHWLQLSPCVLDALKPNCRLHIRRFCLRSIVRPAEETGQIVIDPYEIRLATSTNLYCIAMNQCPFDDAGNHNFNEEAVLQLVSGAAPNLKECYVQTYIPGSTPGLVRATSTPHRPWPRDAFRTDGSSLITKGVLKSLHLYGGPRNTIRSLSRWTRVTDFASLQSLTMSAPIEADATRFLRQFAMPSLQHLQICLSTADQDGFDEGHEQAEHLFCSLSPLQSLSLRTGGLCRVSLVESILRHHGVALRTLHLPHNIQPSAIHVILESMRDQCPSLEELALGIPRTEGDSTEVATYRCIGNLTRIRRVCLTFDCLQASTKGDLSTFEGQRFQPDNQLTSDEVTVRNIDVRTALVNCAIDADLVKAIFNVISNAKPCNSWQLQQLEINVQEYKFDQGYPFSFHLLMYPMGKSWLCTRAGADGGKSHKIVARLKDESQNAPTAYPELDELDENILPVMRSIWPQITDSKSDFGNLWSSIPLQLEDQPRP